MTTATMTSGPVTERTNNPFAESARLTKATAIVDLLVAQGFRAWHIERLNALPTDKRDAGWMTIARQARVNFPKVQTQDLIEVLMKVREGR